jgi:hypothetical protein
MTFYVRLAFTSGLALRIKGAAYFTKSQRSEIDNNLLCDDTDTANVVQSQLMRFYITTRFGTVTKKMGIMTVLMQNRAWTLLSQRPSSSKIFILVECERPIDAIAKIIADVRQ